MLDGVDFCLKRLDRVVGRTGDFLLHEDRTMVHLCVNDVDSDTA